LKFQKLKYHASSQPAILSNQHDYTYLQMQANRPMLGVSILKHSVMTKSKFIFYFRKQELSS